MVIEVPVKGYFEENCFFYIDDESKHGFIIDPGAQTDRLLALIREKGWTIEKILLTHGHFDHMGAVDEIRDALNIPVIAHRRSAEYLLDAGKNLSALCGPAITVDRVMYFSEKDRVSFVGDTIFKGSIGNYRYPGGNPRDLQRSILDKIFTLPDDTLLYSGHSEQTTAGMEKRRYGY